MDQKIKKVPYCDIRAVSHTCDVLSIKQAGLSLAGEEGGQQGQEGLSSDGFHAKLANPKDFC